MNFLKSHGVKYLGHVNRINMANSLRKFTKRKDVHLAFLIHLAQYAHFFVPLKNGIVHAAHKPRESGEAVTCLSIKIEFSPFYGSRMN